MNKSWYVYMLRCKNGSLYTGITTDTERRFNEHKNETVGAKYTKANKPLAIVLTESYTSRSEATRRESAIKKLKKADKEKLVSTV